MSNISSQSTPSVDAAPLRIALRGIGLKEWLGGITYIEFLFRAVRTLPKEQQPLMFFIPVHMESLELYADTIALADGVIFMGQDIRPLPFAPTKPIFQVDDLDNLLSSVDLVYPIQNVIPHHPSAGYWIGDFQQLYFPHFFTDQAIAQRDHEYGFFAAEGHTVVLSSQNALNDFKQQYPQAKALPWVLPFHFLPLENIWDGNPEAIAKKYGLPEKYLICCNQFWMHKNHIRVFEALTILKNQGHKIPVVFTGHMSDGRDPKFFPGLMDTVKDWGIDDQCRLLGILPREEQLQLIRRSAGVIQPSLFEGWSTVVEDIRALGKPSILSDIAIHREQTPPRSSFFPPQDAKVLASLMRELYTQESPGPDLSAEANARQELAILVEEYGRSFCNLAHRCRSHRG